MRIENYGLVRMSFVMVAGIALSVVPTFLSTSSNDFLAVSYT